ncbi:MAG: hypothetical protein KatS3mg003_0736 [Candidatus Nitrosocaldaceae archaeon]|nr:MAG: hypothetical protein KatS3mg003_0713 [Candidatus Nitrosocaldaceae archaeon]GIU71257.1 MAG: hypothetical protein KatS3mg003_0736 [Candidatus Nitrosocaldaceae archaeon]
MLDESIFVYDVIVKKVWIYKDYRPIVKIIGSHNKTFVFGSLSIDNKQLFRQYDRFNTNTFLKYLKELHKKFHKMILFMDNAKQHKAKKVIEYLDKNKDTITVIWFPTASPEFNAVEECWRQGEKDLFHCKFYNKFIDMKRSISEYYRTKRFKLNIIRYLTREAL